MTSYARVSSPHGKVAHLALPDTLTPLCPAGNLTGPLPETADHSLPECGTCKKIAARTPQAPAMPPEPSLPAADAGAAETGRDHQPCGDPSRSAAPQTPAGGEPAAAARPSSPPDRIHVPPVAAARPRFARPWWLRLGRKGGGE